MSPPSAPVPHHLSDFINYLSREASIDIPTDVIQNYCQKHLPLLENRKSLNFKRLQCVSRRQYKRSCGISSLTGCFNFLFTTLGHGDLKPITQEDSIRILGLDSLNSNYNEIKFGSFTGNGTLRKWFSRLCRHFGVKGKSRILFKLVGRGKTSCSPSEAREKLCNGLQDNNKAFIYHSYNHYCCPIGFDVTPHDPELAYNRELDPVQKHSSSDTWIYVGDSSAKHGPIHSMNWNDIVVDLSQRNPHYFNTREPWKGVQKKENPSKKKRGRNLHCIIEFSKIEDDISEEDIETEEELENYVVEKKAPVPPAPVAFTQKPSNIRRISARRPPLVQIAHPNRTPPPATTAPSLKSSKSLSDLEQENSRSLFGTEDNSKTVKTQRGRRYVSQGTSVMKRSNSCDSQAADEPTWSLKSSSRIQKKTRSVSDSALLLPASSTSSAISRSASHFSVNKRVTELLSDPLVETYVSKNTGTMGFKIGKTVYSPSVYPDLCNNFE